MRFFCGVYVGVWASLLMRAIWWHFEQESINLALGALAVLAMCAAPSIAAAWDRS